MKEYIAPILLISAAIIALSGVVVFSLELFGDGVKIGGMTFYFK